MSLLKYFMRLQYIDFLIQRKATGDQETFARKNNLSKRGLANVLEDMRRMGFPIKFDKCRKSYYYTKKGYVPSTLFIEDHERISRSELKGIGTEDFNNVCFSDEKIFTACK